MKPTHCPSCGSDDLFHRSLRGYFMLGLLRGVPLYGAACLACGIVTQYLDDNSLSIVRAWSHKEGKAKATVDEV